tara:strand:+ start:1982 stop:3349 length:1368 start_codon:yes stop_codon:yes gene_type:complete
MSTILNARSPYYIKITPAANTITSVTMSLYIYSGTFTTDKPASPQYTLTKTPLSGNNFVIFEISGLVKDFLDTEYANFSTDGVWVEADSAITTNAGSESQSLDLLGFEGYGYFENGVNPRESTNPVNTLVSSTTTGSTTAFKLIDSTQTFTQSVTVGDTVNNTSDATSTTIAAVESNTELSLVADIMTSTPDNYTIVAQPNFTPAYMQSNTKIYFKQGTDIVFPVFVEAEPTITFTSGGGANVKWNLADEFWNLFAEFWGSTLNPIVVTDTNNSTLKIKYIRVTPTNSLQTGDTITVVSTKSGYAQSHTITLEAVCEIKYQQLQVIFYNKFGALQIMPFFKKSTTSISTQSDSFQRDIMDFTNDPTYDKSKHVVATLGVNGKEKISMNTGYIEESYNEVITQLLLSEQIWVDDGTNILPINLNTKSLTFKKSVNDRLINYTLDFNYAFDKINNVR